MANAIKTSMAGNPVYPVMFAIGACHLLNDTLQAVIPAMFPILEEERGLTFTPVSYTHLTLPTICSV